MTGRKDKQDTQHETDCYVRHTTTLTGCCTNVIADLSKTRAKKRHVCATERVASSRPGQARPHRTNSVLMRRYAALPVQQTDRRRLAQRLCPDSEY
ncbi:hypothetical protein NPX13_g10954 [Xylaria arbuscula]|uniref:Uncharacterized protein n=1 Tax=Xylaria arbuscula TaxID=114810 RepID=A0A9W8THE5_9PEZI|nr:hypothetical protein NPX13_g10954 [Xylaria arbuscula]